MPRAGAAGSDCEGQAGTALLGAAGMLEKLLQVQSCDSSLGT